MAQFPFCRSSRPELSDRMLADFMGRGKTGLSSNLHIQSIDHNEAIKTIKRKITDLDPYENRGTEKKQSAAATTWILFRPDLATYGGEAKNLLRDLQSRNERMFLLTLLVLNLADNK